MDKNSNRDRRTALRLLLAAPVTFAGVGLFGFDAACAAALTREYIRARSTVLTALEKDGKIKIVASMYHLVGGRVEFLK